MACFAASLVMSWQSGGEGGWEGDVEEVSERRRRVRGRRAVASSRWAVRVGLDEPRQVAPQLAFLEHVAAESVPVHVRHSLRAGLGWRREGGEDAV